MRVALVAGPGGSGVTTIAAATARGSAEAGRHTVFLTGDPLALDILGGSEKECPALTVRLVDPRRQGERAWPLLAQYLAGFGIAEGLDPAECASLPGAAAVATLLDIAAISQDGACEMLVIDAGADPVRLISLVDSVGMLADRLLPAPMKLLRQWGGLFSRRSASAHQGADLMGTVLNKLLLAQAVLTDPRITGAQVVTTDAGLRRKAARAMVPALALFGVGLGRVVVNQVHAHGEPTADDESWGVPTVRIPALPGEPTGDGLRPIAESLFADASLTAGPALVDPPVSKRGDGYQLAVPLPQAQRETLALSRSGDDLLISVGAWTRRWELPSVLTRCRVTGANFSGGALVVDFEPDPAAWPQALASSLPGGTSDG